MGIQRWEELGQDSATGRSLWPDLARERHQEEAAQGGCRERRGWKFDIISYLYFLLEDKLALQIQSLHFVISHQNILIDSSSQTK